MGLGKQVTTYLRGAVAEAYEIALEKQRTTSYSLLGSAVESYLREGGYLAQKATIKLVPGMAGWKAYAEGVERKAQAVIADSDVLRRVLELNGERDEAQQAPEAGAVRRRRRVKSRN